MKRPPIKTVCVVTILLVALGGFIVAGCEKARGTRALVVIPGFADLTSGFTNFTQNFEVDPESIASLSLPLTWRVSNPALGNITSSGGRTASYTRTRAHGDNSIFVEDQLGAQGTATVRQ